MISELQLTTWTNAGPQVAAETTYASVKAALNAYGPLKARSDVEVYLQGSYRNSTNIRGDSDVDVVIEYSGAFYSKLNRLTEAERNQYSKIFPTNASYGYNDFRADVERALQAYYRAPLIKLRNKCIQITGESGRLNADVVPCLRLRDFHTLAAQKTDDYWPGIQFFTRNEARVVINYPKPHFDNGAAKNGRVNGNYKPAVRMFKNLRNWLVDNKKLVGDDVPSYFLECLIYNVPDEHFTKQAWQMRCGHALIFLSKADLSKFTCQNGLVWLFGNTPEQWNIEKAKRFIQAAVDAMVV